MGSVGCVWCPGSDIVQCIRELFFQEKTMTVDEIVKQHVKASQKFRKSIKQSPEKARKFLISAGILNKKGTQLAKVYR